MVAISAGCTRQRNANDAAASGDAIRVGSRHFTEQLILGQITMQALAANGIPTEDRTGLTSTEAARSALEDGEIDVYWEYIGTAWHVIMGRKPVEKNDTRRWVFERVRDIDAPNGIIWTEPALLTNRFALAMTRERSQALGIRTLSDLGAHTARNPGDLSLAGIHSFTVRTDGLPGLREIYGIDFAGNISLMVLSMAYYAVANGFVDVSMAMTTDWRIQHYGLVVLEDDRNFFPFYSLAPAFRADALERHPQAQDILNSIAARLTDEALQYLNLRVDRDGMTPTAVAGQWLRVEGFHR